MNLLREVNSFLLKETMSFKDCYLIMSIKECYLIMSRDKIMALDLDVFKAE